MRTARSHHCAERWCRSHIRLQAGLTFAKLRRETTEATPKLLRKQNREKENRRRWDVMVHNEASAVRSGRCLPFLNDDDHGAQQEDEDHQTSSAHPQNQTHLLGVLGDL